MPQAYDTPSGGLALPISPPPSPPSSHGSRQTRRIPRRSMSYSGPDRNGSIIEQALSIVGRLQRTAIRTWQAFTPMQKVLAVLFASISLAIGVVFLVYSERIFAWLEPMAQAWKDMPGGWLILWLLAVITAFPPLIGYSTCVTIAGFVYGFPLGWPIVATANVAGSFLSFLVFRNLLSHWADRLANADPRFKALTLVLKHDGLKLLVMIRLCPLPYSFSNGAMSTFESVSPASFALATAIATPKLLIHVFIGSRLRLLAKSDSRRMDTGTKIVNYVSIILGIALGLFTGWWVYTKTQARARQLEVEEEERLHGDRPRSAYQAEAGGLQHPDAFMDEDEEADFEWGSPSPGLEDDEAQFTGHPNNAPYVDNPMNGGRKV